MSHRTRTPRSYSTVDGSANPPSINEFPARLLAAAAKADKLTIRISLDGGRAQVTFEVDDHEPEQMIFCTRDDEFGDACGLGIVALDAFGMKSIHVLDELNRWMEDQEWWPSDDDLPAEEPVS